MTLYEELKKCIAAYNQTDPSKTLLQNRLVTKDGNTVSQFVLRLDGMVLFYVEYIIIGEFTEEKAKHLAATQIINYLTKTRLPVWKESLS